MILPMSRLETYAPAPVHYRCKHSQSATAWCIYPNAHDNIPILPMSKLDIYIPVLIHNRCRYSQPARARCTYQNKKDILHVRSIDSPIIPISRSTIIKCDNDRDAFQCSRAYSRKLVYILFKYLPLVLKHVLYFANKFFDDLLFMFLHVFQGATNVSRWVICCKISFIHTPAWIVNRVSLLVQQNLHRRHTFRALYNKFLLKTKTREEFQHSTNVSVFFLKLLRELCYISPRDTYTRPLRFHTSKLNSKSSNRPCTAEASTSTQLPTRSQKLHRLPKRQGDVGGHKGCTFSAKILEPYLTATVVPSKSSQTRYSFIDHVDVLGAQKYPTDRYTHASLPLHDIVPV